MVEAMLAYMAPAGGSQGATNTGVMNTVKLIVRKEITRAVNDAQATTITGLNIGVSQGMAQPFLRLPRAMHQPLARSRNEAR